MTALKDDDSSKKMYYAKVLAMPKKIKKIIQQSKNGERIELDEHEKRSMNVILHGA